MPFDWLPGGDSFPDLEDISPERFEEMVLGIVATWLVSGVLAGYSAVLEAIMSIQGSFRSVGAAMGTALETLYGIIQSVPYYLIGPANEVIQTVAATTGPLAPILVVVLWVGVVLATMYAMRVTLTVLIRVFPFA